MANDIPRYVFYNNHTTFAHNFARAFDQINKGIDRTRPIHTLEFSDNTKNVNHSYDPEVRNDNWSSDTIKNVVEKNATIAGYTEIEGTSGDCTFHLMEETNGEDFNGKYCDTDSFQFNK